MLNRLTITNLVYVTNMVVMKVLDYYRILDILINANICDDLSVLLFFDIHFVYLGIHIFNLLGNLR